MAVTFRLENYSAGTLVDLAAGDAKLDTNGWQSYPDGNRVVEVFPIVVTDTSRANVRAALNDVIEILEDAVKFHATGLETESVWLRAMSDGETARRALIYSYELQPVVRSGVTQLLNLGTGLVAFWQLAITRDREWEVVTDTTVSTINMVTGDIWDLTATTGGQVDGRITSIEFTNNADDIDALWCGILEPRRPGGIDTTLMSGILDLANPDATKDASEIADGDGYGTDTIQITFLTSSDWAVRCYQHLPDNSPESPVDCLNYVGRWLILLRARVGASTAAMARLAISTNAIGGGNGALVRGPAVYVDSTAYKLYELGEFQFPAWGYRTKSFSDYMTALRLNLEARLVSGTGYLYADSLVLIPAEHLFTWTGATKNVADVSLNVDTQEDGTVVGVVTTGTTPDITVESIAAVTTRNWRYPKGGGALFMAIQDNTDGHTLADDVDIELNFRKRYLGYVE